MLARAAGGCGEGFPSDPLPFTTPLPPLPSRTSSWYTHVPVCIGGASYTCIRKLGGEFLLKQTPGRERVAEASGRGGLQRSGKERICKGKPGDPVSVSEGRQSVSFPSAQKRTSARINEPDILIRRGKCSRELEEPLLSLFFFHRSCRG